MTVPHRVTREVSDFGEPVWVAWHGDEILGEFYSRGAAQRLVDLCRYRDASP